MWALAWAVAWCSSKARWLYFIPLALRGLAAAAHLLLSDPPYPEALERYKATETRPAC